MRVGRVRGRLAVLTGDRAIDVARVSDGRFPSDPDLAFDRWDELIEWAGAQGTGDAEPYTADDLGAPVLRPAQIFAVGMNYGSHAAEVGLTTVPSGPAVFTKFATCLTGPYDTVALPSTGVDWETELVAVIGRRAERVSQNDAWSHVAGLMVGQDLSERTIQLAGPAPQFSLGKSFPGFGPIGPAIVTTDELANPDDLELTCSVENEVLQKGRTGDMIFSVSELIARISAVCPLLPGDLIFTGTPAGVGNARTPKLFLAPGTTLVSSIEGIGELRNRLVAGPDYPRLEV
ncbi:fumarylacetoacetate hydrolase family protein [Streptomyces sp. GbtcB7]|uniref:fumarylacetoacetate hydrolase family protein n=1 Tax=Streptomyces sp. GbtcB7 TaxID=2824752 RepID=UPI001C306ED4|nr:fumarylacetoacetate hydrolase family protein [Streptomyces sp. GbtcB7]